MNTIDIKEGGSFWQWTTLFGVHKLPKNGCSLLGELLINGVIITFVCIALGAFFGDLFANLLAFAVTGIYEHGTSMYILTGATTLVLILSAIGLIVIIVFAPFAIVKEAKQDSDNKFMRGLANIKTLYKGHKEKFCPLVRKV